MPFQRMSVVDTQIIFYFCKHNDKVVTVSYTHLTLPTTPYV